MKTKGPVLLVVNHPDSFLDAVIIGALYPRKINYLARGDVFRNPVFGFLLRQLNMLPVFRQREGKEHLQSYFLNFEESGQGGVHPINFHERDKGGEAERGAV
jgi:1-acyl-sn-glycerol-3-phosphate acyltransferase